MSFDIGILVLRVVVGLILAAHGSRKLFGWFGGPGIKGTSGWLGSMRMRPAAFWAVMAGLAEFGGGLLLALGFLSPLGPVAIIASMLMATFLVHWPRFWSTESGFEFPLTNLVIALAVAITGPGRYSLDALWNIAFPAPATLIVLLALTVLGLGAAFALRIPEERREQGGQAAHPARG
jgi:putative oxidoreductase